MNTGHDIGSHDPDAPRDRHKTQQSYCFQGYELNKQIGELTFDNKLTCSITLTRNGVFLVGRTKEVVVPSGSLASFLMHDKKSLASASFSQSDYDKRKKKLKTASTSVSPKDKQEAQGLVRLRRKGPEPGPFPVDWFGLVLKPAHSKVVVRLKLIGGNRSGLS